MSTILSQLWTGPAPAPSTFKEYAARTVLPDPAVLDEFHAAAKRMPVLQAAGEEIASRLMFRRRFDLPSAISLLCGTMDPGHVDGVLEAIRDEAFQEAKRLALGNTWQAFSDPHGAPYQKLVQEFPHLRENLKTKVFAPMLLRAKAELDRITPLEESRMIDKARSDVAALGMKPKDVPNPGKSPLVQEWEDYLGRLSTTQGFIVGGRQHDRMEGYAGQWFYVAKQTLEEIIPHLRTAANP